MNKHNKEYDLQVIITEPCVLWQSQKEPNFLRKLWCLLTKNLKILIPHDFPAENITKEFLKDLLKKSFWEDE